MFKRLLALTMTILFLFSFSGCGGEKKDVIPAFIETDMGKTSGLSLVRGVRVNSKDQLVVYTFDEKTGEARYALLDKDGKQVGSIKCDFDGEGYLYTLDENDNLCVLAQSFTMDESKKTVKEIDRKLVVFDMNGTRIKTMDLGKIIPENGFSQMNGFEMDSDGNIYLLERTKNVEVFDKEGRSLGSIGSQGYSCMCMDSEGALFLGSDGQGKGNNKSTLEKIKTPKGESMWKKDPGFNDVPRLIRYGRNDKCIYTLTERGIKKYSSSGADKGYVFDSKQTSMTGFNSFIDNMDMDSAGNYYFTVAKSTGSGESGDFQTGFYKYALINDGEGNQANNKNTEQKTLTLSTLETNQYLESAISEFQKKYPEIKIEVKGCPSISNQEDINKFVTTLNTELMSNKGSDLISTELIPSYKYISKGIFANLSDMLAKDSEIDLKQYHTNILDSFKYKGNLYVMPMSIFIETMAVNGSILEEENIKIDDTKWTWKDFLEVCKKLTKDTNGDGTPEQYALPYMPNGYILSKMFTNSYTQFIDRENKKATLDSPEFISMLKLAKEFSDSKVTCTNEKATYMSNDWFDLYDRNGVAFIPSTLYEYGTMGFYGANTLFLQPPSVNGVYKPSYNTWLMLAINDKSKYKEESWKFIKFLISKDMQTPRGLNGFVVHKEADAYRKEYAINSTSEGKSFGFYGRRIMPLTETFLSAAGRLSANTGFMPDYDQQLLKIVYSEADGFLKGNKTAETAAKAMQNKISLYLNE